MKTVVGIDNGTQSTKVLFYDFEERQVVAEASSPHPLVSRSDGSREQEAASWLGALKDCFDQIDQKIKKSAQALGVSGQQHGFVPLDREGRVLAPVKLWCDTSTAIECQELSEAFGGRARLIRELGNPLLPGYTASKILHFKKRDPRGFGKMAWVLLPHDYLNYHLNGRISMEYGDASGTGLLNIYTRTWSQELVELIDPRLWETLPPLLGPTEGAGTLSPEAARRYGLPEGIPLSTGGGDNMMGAIGTGTLREGQLTMSLGTSGTLYAYAEQPLVAPDGSLAAFCSSTGGWLPLYCTMNCTVATELERQLLGASLQEMEAEAQKAPIGAQGLLTIPFFNGERAPDLPRATGSLLGLRGDNFNRPNLLRSAMESAVLSLKRGLETFTSLGYTTRELRLIGGGSRSALWRQMVADIFELPVVLPRVKEAAALGGALQALALLKGEGLSTLEEYGEGVEEACLPRQENRAPYQEVYANYKRQVEKIIEEEGE